MAQQGSIPRDFIEQLLARADIVDIINQRVPLKKAGATFKACCPFHQEKTPSFNVNPQKQFYHCFGCGASGDALKFLMEYEGLGFVEAIESLAQSYGMEVPRQKISREQQKQQQKAKDYYDLMKDLARFYRLQLRDHPGSNVAKNYLRDRGLTAEIAKTYQIGFAPPGWDAITKLAQPDLVVDANTKQQLIDLGMLVAKDDGGSYDRFRNRIMFPIRDGRGRVVAFGGRVLTDEDQPKYLNSPETPIFHKSNALYGLFEMRQARISIENIIVVEGYMDVVSLAQFGVQNAVATLGTATTLEHLQMLFRQTNEIIFCFDGDNAGLKAAWRALKIALPMMENNRSVKFLFLPDGEDPDSIVRREGAQGFNQRTKNALTLSQFWLQGLQNRITDPITSYEGRQQMVALAQPYIMQTVGLYQYLLVEAVADLVNLPAWRLEKQLGVRSGFAQFKPQVGKAQNQPTKPITQVMSLSKQLVKILLTRPDWAPTFFELFAEDLTKTKDRDQQLLLAVLHQLSQGVQVTDLIAWILQAGFQAEYEFLQARELPMDEAVLQAMAEELAGKLFYELEAQQILQSPLDKAGLQKLNEYFSSQFDK